MIDVGMPDREQSVQLQWSLLSERKSPGSRDHDGRLSDDVFAAHMPSFSSISDPIAWVNNAIRSGVESLPITPAKSGEPNGQTV